MDGALYNLKAVVQRTGIPAASLRAWEKRYALLSPVRKPNGHRAYPVSEIEKLLRVKALLAQGLSISQATEQVLQAQPEHRPATETERIQLALTSALHSGDVRGANQVFAEALDLLGADRFCLHILRPLLAALTPFGRTFLRHKLGALLLHGSAPGEGAVVVLAPELADLRPLLVAVILARRGSSVVYVEGDGAPDFVRSGRLLRAAGDELDEYLNKLV